MTHKHFTQAEAVQMAVNKFLGMKLPHDFYPDCHISFDREKASTWPHSWPIGTNLLTAAQAKAMFEFCLADYFTAQMALEKLAGEAVAIPEWQSELKANHPTSDPQYWPDELMFKYCHREVDAYRSLKHSTHPIAPSESAAVALLREMKEKSAIVECDWGEQINAVLATKEQK